MRISIRDVAREACVSVSAASKALNDYPDISPETKEKVREAAGRIGYIPNQSAKNLSSKSSKNVAVLLSGLLEDVQTDDYVIGMMKGAVSYISEHNMNAAIYAIDSKLQERKSLSDFCHEFSLAGVLLFGLKMTDRYYREAASSDIPCVVVDYNITGVCTSSVCIDDRLAFEEITSYMLNHNHSKLVLVSGRTNSRVCEERYKGFQDALKKYAVSEKDVTVLHSDFKEELSFQNAKAYLEQFGKEQATAFLCMSDMMAMGVFRAVKACGYRVPEDFSVTGFDGFEFLKYVDPRLTTVDQNGRGKGYEAGRLLEQLVEGERNLDTVILPYELITGDSVKNLKSGKETGF